MPNQAEGVERIDAISGPMRRTGWSGMPRDLPYTPIMAKPSEIEFVFEPQDEGGYHVYAPDLPGLHTQGDTLDEAIANAEEALQLYVEGLRDEGRPIGAGIVRRTLPVPA